MAVDFKAPSLTRTSEYMIAPHDIKFKPSLNGRHEVPNVDWLIESFAEIGQITPVGVRKDGDDAVLCFGFSRWRAAVEGIKRKKLPADFKLRCVYHKANEEQGFLANIAENRERNPTTALDDAHNIARLERYGKSLEEIVKIYHPTDEFGAELDDKKALKWVKERLALVSLSKSSEEALKNGDLKPSAAKVLATLSEEQQAFALKQSKKNGTPLTAASLKAPKAPKAKDTPLLEADKGNPFVDGDPQELYDLVKSIAEGGEIPFDWQFDVDARKFCKKLLQEL
jgi:ParB-like chromosome segregation protein Spo0J